MWDSTNSVQQRHESRIYVWDSNLTIFAEFCGKRIKRIAKNMGKEEQDSCTTICKELLPNSFSVSIGTGEPTESNGKISIVDYRKFLVAKFITKALEKLGGYSVDPEQYYVIPEDSIYRNSLFIIRKNGQGHKTALRLIPGNIIVKLRSLKETDGTSDMSVEHFQSLRLQEVKAARVGQENNLSWIISPSNLTTAIINYDLLVKDPSLDIELVAIEHKDSENSGMMFIMDNYAKLLSILRRFTHAIKNEEYPSLPPLEIVGYEHLTSSNDKDLLKAILEWTQTLERTVDFLKLEVNITATVKFMKDLAFRFNHFYSYTKILVPTKSLHNYNKMYARIHMLQACLKVFEEFLELMQIEWERGLDYSQNE